MLLTDLDALLITKPTNIRYLTGFVGASPTEREAYVLLTSTHLYFFTNPLYLELAKKLVISSQSAVRKLEIIEVSREKQLSKLLKEVLDSSRSETGLSRTIKVGFEENNLTVAEYKKLQSELDKVEFVHAAGRVEELRKIKKPQEIEFIRKAARITDQCFDFILKKLKVGVTESEIAWDIESFFHKNNATSAFSPIVAFGKNTSQPHYSPSAHCKLQTANLVLLDFGARVNGYCADMTRVVFIGKPTAKQKKAYQVLLAAQTQAFSKLESYFSNEVRNFKMVKRDISHPTKSDSKNNSIISGAELDRVARKTIEDSGLPPYPHSLGHAVGLDIHETPRLSIHQDATLEPGMVFTIEPGIYLEGEFGIRIEDLVLITKSGIEVLSKSSKQLHVL